jgi:hypothetical protein
MSEGWVVVAFFLPMGLLVARIVRAQGEGEQVAGDAHPSLRGGVRETNFEIRRQHRRYDAHNVARSAFRSTVSR